MNQLRQTLEVVHSPRQRVREPVVHATHRDPTILRRRSFTLKMCCDFRIPSDLMTKLWSDADHLVDCGTPLKNGDTTTVVRIDAAENLRLEKSWMLKRYNQRGLFYTAGHLLSRSRAERNWTYGRRLCSNGISSPRPTAFLECRVGPFQTRSYLLTEYISGLPLNEFVQRAKPSGPVLDKLCCEFQRIWNRLGVLRMSHGDMKATNFLVSEDTQLWLIDLDGMRTHHLKPKFHLARERDWNRFLRNWQSEPSIVSAFVNTVNHSRRRFPPETKT